jgi:hypothetical protein
VQAQAIFSLLEKKHPPCLNNLSSSSLSWFYIMGAQGIYNITKTWYHELFSEIESNFKSVQFFLYTLYIVTSLLAREFHVLLYALPFNHAVNACFATICYCFEKI